MHMPNWCENGLHVTGPRDEVRRFVKQAEGSDSVLLFDNFVPMPKTKENTEGGGWFHWCTEHWGTKWEACEVKRMTREDDGVVVYDFITAWAPPVEWLTAVAKQFPALHFWLRYEEPGMGFQGEAVGANGEVCDREWSFSSA